jgi:hypothetical protein
MHDFPSENALKSRFANAFPLGKRYRNVTLNQSAIAPNTLFRTASEGSFS